MQWQQCLFHLINILYFSSAVTSHQQRKSWSSEPPAESEAHFCGRHWKTGRSRMRAMKREPGAVKEEWVLCWESGWWVCDAEGAALNQCYSHWGHFKCFSVEIQFLVTSEDVSSVAVYSICSIFSDVERNCWRKLSENGSAARCCPCGVSMLSHLWEIFVCSDVRTQNMFVLYMNETVREVSGVYWSPSSQHMLLETKSYSW